MKLAFVEYLRCPNTLSKLTLTDAEIINDKIKFGILNSDCGLYQYTIHNYIARFVKTDNYANSFGWQWNKFKKTQFDSYSGFPITFNRFWKATNWEDKIQKGEWILDAGCGSGRFAEISSNTNANIVAIDYSTAVDACYENLGNRDNLIIIQCDIYQLPFENGFFDKIYSLGVLQHTPDVKEAVRSLSLKIKAGGDFCIDFYEKSFKSMLLPKYWLRPFTKRMNKEKVFVFLEKNVDSLLRISRILRKIPFMGKLLARIVPVADYSTILPLSEKQIREWAILDTFDWLTPSYDNPQTRKTIHNWLIEFGFGKIEVLKEGHIVGRGNKV
jgi:ubiquinone/menaquinone biosynthesis C-methylase UbiE